MRFGKVVGNIWATEKHEGIKGLKLLIVRDIKPDGTLKDNYVIAADTLGAGIGENVIMVRGSATRRTDSTRETSADTVIVGIIDTIEVKS